VGGREGGREEWRERGKIRLGGTLFQWRRCFAPYNLLICIYLSFGDITFNFDETKDSKNSMT